MTYISSSHNWLVVLTAVVIVGMCAVLHYEVLSLSNRYLPALSRRRRPRVLILIGAVLLAHFAEIWLFGGGYYLLAGDARFGRVAGLESAALPEFVYFSAMTYTTVGFGDVVPLGAIRFMAGVEALTGLVMITWSASYTFFEIQRDWSPR